MNKNNTNLKTESKETILDRLEKVAYKASSPFCSSCYEVVLTTYCLKCGTDDFQRYHAEKGPDWGLESILQHLLEQNLTPVNTEETFEDFVSDCYSDSITIGWIHTDCASAIKALDPISWNIAKDEYVESQTSDGIFFTYDNGASHYLTSDVEDYLEKIEAE